MMIAEGRCGGTHEEHLQFAKSRALAILESGDVAGAHASMISDLGKHESFRTPGYQMAMQMGMLELMSGAAKERMRHWIEGFN
jgi:hypothetical protein